MGSQELDSRIAELVYVDATLLRRGDVLKPPIYRSLTSQRHGYVAAGVRNLLDIRKSKLQP